MNKILLDHTSFLVVDNNLHMRRLVRSLLHGFGSRQVYEAEDGAVGLESIESYEPDVIITDLIMPILDGFELIRVIRNSSNQKISGTPIIILTSHTEKQRVIQARDTGANSFLAKPISAKALYDRIYYIIKNQQKPLKNEEINLKEEEKEENYDP
ncbi:MAG: response regulator [Alphaproteobacteria bacterium]|nr:response regulator [Alphaproteobacteria bacterium]